MQTSLEHPEKSLGTKFPKFAWIWGFRVTWIRHGLFLESEKGLQNILAWPPMQILAVNFFFVCKFWAVKSFWKSAGEFS